MVLCTSECLSEDHLKWTLPVCGLSLIQYNNTIQHSSHPPVNFPVTLQSTFQSSSSQLSSHPPVNFPVTLQSTFQSSLSWTLRVAVRAFSIVSNFTITELHWVNCSVGPGRRRFCRRPSPVPSPLPSSLIYRVSAPSDCCMAPGV